jgi:exopolyphosphatase / guanosine-5'-triphosphate,3'-diphosphate pyrophosphatase
VSLQPECRAVIDIGTNSIKVLVAEVTGHHVRSLHEEIEQTRLGEGLYENGRLGHDAMFATAWFAGKFADLARARQAGSIRVIATSAARDAVNQAELSEAIEQKSGLKLEIISGAQEAELTFRGVASDGALGDQRFCVLEVGGGSAQFIVGESGQMLLARSFNIGGVRLLEQFRPSGVPVPGDLDRCRQWLNEFFAGEVEPVLGPLLGAGQGGTTLLGVGGAAKSLLRMEVFLNTEKKRQIKTEGVPLATISDWVGELWRMSISERKRLVGLKKKRADVIPFGAAIYEAAMRKLAMTHLRVSQRGLRHGALVRLGP